MVYPKTFTSFARHAFQKAGFAAHNTSQSGAGHASSFFNQSFAGASRGQLGHGAIANRFQSQFGFHTGKNNPSQGTNQTTLYGPIQNSMAASTGNDDREQEATYRSSKSITRHINRNVFSGVAEVEPSEPKSHRSSTFISQPTLTEEIPLESETGYRDVAAQPNLLSTNVLDSTTLQSYETKVSTLMEKGEFGSVVSVYHDMKRQGFMPNENIYNDIIVSMSRTLAKEPVNAIVDTYSEMLDQQIQPSISTTSVVIETLCKRASEVTEIIAETQLRMERDSSLVSEGQTKVDQLNGEENLAIALGLFEAATEAVFQRPSVQTFNSMFEAFGKCGFVEQVLHVYEKMEALQVAPNADTFAHLIIAFGKYGDMRSAIECYNEYKRQARTLSPHDEDIIYEALISSYFASGDMTSGVQFLRKIEAIPGKYVSRRIYDAVVRGLCEKNDIGTAMNWVRRMKTSSSLPNPSVSTIKPIVANSCKIGDLETAREAFETLGRSRIGAGHLWMLELQFFVSLCLQEGDLRSAVIVMDEFLLQNMIPDSDIVSIFLRKLSNHSGADRPMEYMVRLAQVFSSNPLSIQDAEFEAIISSFVLDTEMNIAVATQLINIVHHHPTVLTSSRNPASQKIVSAFREAPENTALEGVTLAGLIKLQSSLLGWDSSHPDDVSHFLSLLCMMSQEDWIHLSPARQTITDNILRLQDLDILGLWTTIVNSNEFVESQELFSFATSNDSVQSNYSRDDTASVATLDTVVTPANSTVLHAPPLRQLSAQYHSDIPHPNSFDIPNSYRILRNLSKTVQDARKLNELVNIVRSVRRSNRKLLPEALGRLILVAGKSHRMDMVREIYEFAQTTVREVMADQEIHFDEWCLIHNSMIIANAFNGNFSDARFHQQELQNLGVAPDADAFAAYIVNLNGTDTNDEATEALAFFHQAKSLGVQPSTFLYNTLISKLAKARRSDDALYYFHEMRINGLTPSSVTFGTVVNACCRVGHEALALKYFNEMESDVMYVPRIAPYNTMIQFYVQTKQDRVQALHFYEKMRSHLITPSAHTYKLLIDAYGTLEPVDVDSAESILNLIASDSQKPTSAHFAAIIHAHGCAKQNLAKAREWFDKVTNREFKNYVKADETLYQAMIESYVANHRVEDCAELLKRMEKEKVKLTAYMANHLIHGWTIAGNLKAAEEVFNSLDSNRNGLYGREPSSYEQMTRTYLAMGDRASALALVEEMKTRRYPSAVVGRVVDILEGGNGFGGMKSNLGIGVLNHPKEIVY